MKLFENNHVRMQYDIFIYCHLAAGRSLDDVSCQGC